MPPSECPLCGRIYCDHTHVERGQTYAEMMGDPAGSPSPLEREIEQQRKKLEERCDRAVELLTKQAVDHISCEDIYYMEIHPGGSRRVYHPFTRVWVHTENDSCITLVVAQDEAPALVASGIDYMQVQGERLNLWTGKRRNGRRQQIQVSVQSITISERADASTSPPRLSGRYSSDGPGFYDGRLWDRFPSRD